MFYVMEELLISTQVCLHSSYNKTVVLPHRLLNSSVVLCLAEVTSEGCLVLQKEMKPFETMVNQLKGAVRISLQTNGVLM